MGLRAWFGENLDQKKVDSIQPILNQIQKSLVVIDNLTPDEKERIKGLLKFLYYQHKGTMTSDYFKYIKPHLKDINDYHYLFRQIKLILRDIGAGKQLKKKTTMNVYLYIERLYESERRFIRHTFLPRQLKSDKFESPEERKQYIERFREMSKILMGATTKSKEYKESKDHYIKFRLPIISNLMRLSKKILKIIQ